MVDNVRVEGLRELSRNLQKLADLVDDKKATGVVKNALRKGARLIRDDAKRKVRKRTHAVENNIVVRTVPARKSEPGLAEVYVTINEKAKKTGKPLFYARFLEFGTVKMSAKPFMRPAFEQNKNKLPGIFKDSVQRQLDKKFKAFK